MVTRRRQTMIVAGVAAAAAGGSWSNATAHTTAPPPVRGHQLRQFAGYTPPPGYGNRSYVYADGFALGGEPSIGVDWPSGAVMYMSLDQVSRIVFDDRRFPATATWRDVTPKQLDGVNQDSVLFTDHATGRTVAAEDVDACSVMAYTDNDGSSWNASQGCPPISGMDHPTVGGGSYAAPTPPTHLLGYRDSVFYCAQSGSGVIGAICGRSDDGGRTFLPAGESVIFGAASPCAYADHGHLRVAPDGTVMVPNHSCAVDPPASHPASFAPMHQGIALSRDNGLTWSYSAIPDGSSVSPFQSDPSVAAGAGNTIYFGYEDGGGHPRIVVSTDHAQTWLPSVDVGAPLGIRHSKFPEVIAGDDDRAAFAWLGTTSDGDDQSAGFRGTWYLYVSFTDDRGRTWSTVNATPGDPVQRGCISNQGEFSSASCRNLLDFNDISIDAQGRVLVAYTDGCADIDHQVLANGSLNGPSMCDSDPGAFANTDKVAVPYVARQSCGSTLFARYDRQVRPCGGAPERAPTSAHAARSGDGPATAGAAPLWALWLDLPRRLVPRW